MLGRGADEAQDWVRSWTAQVSARAEAATALADRVSRISATVTAAGGAVRVTVGGAGVVTGLELDDRVRRMSGADLSAEILRAIRRAQAGLTDQVAIAVRETVGADSDSGRAVLNSFARRFPAAPDDADDGRPPGSAERRDG